MKIDRRQFLKLAAGGGLLSFLAPSRVPGVASEGLVGEVEGFSVPPVGSFEERYHVCEVCANQCATILRLQNGKIREIWGNSADQLGGQGKVCVKGASAMRMLYDPDRLKTPLKRTNPQKGKDQDPKWVKITWDEAFRIIGAKYRETIQNYGPESLCIISTPNEPAKHLQKCLGTPNFISHGDTCYLSQFFIWQTTTGTPMPNTMDLANTKYILSFGWDQPGKSKMSFLQGFMKARENGAKVVVFDPRLSVTASLADEWIPIRPGSDLAVVLAMLNVIINEDLYDHEFVANYTEGFDGLVSHVQKYTPAWAAKLSDVPAEDIIRIAREFATTRPSFIPTHKRDAAGPTYFNSFELGRAQLALCALVGSIDRPGGWVFPRTFKVTPLSKFVEGMTFPTMSAVPHVSGEDDYPLVKGSGRGGFSTIADAILSGEPYPIKAGFAGFYNIRSFANPDRLVEALKTLDFFVVFDIMPTEMAMMADVVLPDLFFLERKGFINRTNNALWPQAMLQEGVDPLYEGKGLGAVVNGIVSAMGRPDLKVDWTAVNAQRFNDIGASPDAMKSNNGIWEKQAPFAPTTEFKTPSKKIELYSSKLAMHGYSALPTWMDKQARPDEQYPFYLLTNHSAWMRMGKLANDPLILEIQAENLLHIHPNQAERLGIKTGDSVWVSSRTGKRLKITAFVDKGIRPDCVMTEHGYGAWSSQLTVAYGYGTNDGDLLPDVTLSEAKAWAPQKPDMCFGFVDVCVAVERA